MSFSPNDVCWSLCIKFSVLLDVHLRPAIIAVVGLYVQSLFMKM